MYAACWFCHLTIRETEMPQKCESQLQMPKWQHMTTIHMRVKLIAPAGRQAANGRTLCIKFQGEETWKHTTTAVAREFLATAKPVLCNGCRLGGHLRDVTPWVSVISYFVNKGHPSHPGSGSQVPSQSLKLTTDLAIVQHMSCVGDQISVVFSVLVILVYFWWFWTVVFNNQ